MKAIQLPEFKNLESFSSKIEGKISENEQHELNEIIRAVRFRFELQMEQNEFLSSYNIYLKKQQTGLEDIEFSVEFSDVSA